MPKTQIPDYLLASDISNRKRRASRLLKKPISYLAPFKSSEAAAQSFRVQRLMDYAEYVYSEDARREDSIIAQTGRMLTLFSLFAALMFSSVTLLFNTIPEMNQNIVLAGMIVITFLLLTSLVFALLAQWRHKQVNFASICEYQVTIETKPDVYRDRVDPYLNLRLETLKKAQERKRLTNGRRAYFIRVSMVTFFICAGANLFMLLGSLTFYIYRR